MQTREQAYDIKVSLTCLHFNEIGLDKSNTLIDIVRVGNAKRITIDVNANHIGVNKHTRQ